jgi:hypothetical protein
MMLLRTHINSSCPRQDYAKPVDITGWMGTLGESLVVTHEAFGIHLWVEKRAARFSL